MGSSSSSSSRHPSENDLRNAPVSFPCDITDEDLRLVIFQGDRASGRAVPLFDSSGEIPAGIEETLSPSSPLSERESDASGRGRSKRKRRHTHGISVQMLGELVMGAVPIHVEGNHYKVHYMPSQKRAIFTRLCSLTLPLELFQFIEHVMFGSDDENPESGVLNSGERMTDHAEERVRTRERGTGSFSSVSMDIPSLSKSSSSISSSSIPRRNRRDSDAYLTENRFRKDRTSIEAQDSVNSSTRRVEKRESIPRSASLQSMSTLHSSSQPRRTKVREFGREEMSLLREIVLNYPSRSPQVRCRSPLGVCLVVRLRDESLPSMIPKVEPPLSCNPSAFIKSSSSLSENSESRNTKATMSCPNMNVSSPDSHSSSGRSSPISVASSSSSLSISVDQLRGGVPLGKYNSLGDFEIDLESMTLNASCSENAGEELYVPSDLFRFLCSCAPSIQRQLERFLGSGEHLLRLIACSSILSTARNGQPFVSVNTFSASLPEFSLQKSLDMWRSCDNVMRALVRFVRDSRLRHPLWLELSQLTCPEEHQMFLDIFFSRLRSLFQNLEKESSDWFLSRVLSGLLPNHRSWMLHSIKKRHMGNLVDPAALVRESVISSPLAAQLLQMHGILMQRTYSYRTDRVSFLRAGSGTFRSVGRIERAQQVRSDISSSLSTSLRSENAVFVASFSPPFLGGSLPKFTLSPHTISERTSLKGTPPPVPVELLVSSSYVGSYENSTQRPPSQNTMSLNDNLPTFSSTRNSGDSTHENSSPTVHPIGETSSFAAQHLQALQCRYQSTPPLRVVVCGKQREPVVHLVEVISYFTRSMFINTHDFLVSPGNSNLCFDTKSTLFESVGLSADVDPDGDSEESDNDLDPVSPLSLSPPLSPRNSAPMSENVNKSRLRGKNCTEIPLPELRQIPRYSHSSFPLVGQSYFGAYGDCYNPELVVQGLSCRPSWDVLVEDLRNFGRGWYPEVFVSPSRKALCLVADLDALTVEVLEVSLAESAADVSSSTELSDGDGEDETESDSVQPVKRRIFRFPSDSSEDAVSILTRISGVSASPFVRSTLDSLATLSEAGLSSIMLAEHLERRLDELFCKFIVYDDVVAAMQVASEKESVARNTPLSHRIDAPPPEWLALVGCSLHDLPLLEQGSAVFRYS